MLKMSASDYLKSFHGIKEAKPKYGNKKVKDDGIVFDSKKEHRRYLQLKQAQKAGMISGLTVHKTYTFPVAYKSGRKITFKPDFVYYNEVTLETVIEDSKGYFLSPEYKIKIAMMKYFFDINVVEV